MKTKKLMDIAGVYAFTVEGPPAPKPVGPQRRQAPGVRNYRAYREIIGLRANAVFPSPLRGPVAIGCIWYLPIPASWPARVSAAARNGKLAHVVKPDAKNLMASVEDALKGIAWVDDSQVCAYLPSLKQYSELNYTRTFVQIWDLTDPDASAKFGELFWIGQDLVYPQIAPASPGQN